MNNMVTCQTCDGEGMIIPRTCNNTFHPARDCDCYAQTCYWCRGLGEITIAVKRMQDAYNNEDDPHINYPTCPECEGYGSICTCYARDSSECWCGEPQCTMCHGQGFISEEEAIQYRERMNK